MNDQGLDSWGWSLLLADVAFASAIVVAINYWQDVAFYLLSVYTNASLAVFGG